MCAAFREFLPIIYTEYSETSLFQTLWGWGGMLNNEKVNGVKSTHGYFGLFFKNMELWLQVLESNSRVWY